MKNLVKSIIFILGFIFLWKNIFSVLWLPKDIIDYFYRLPKNSIDVVYIGGSNVCSSFNPLLAYNLYGFKTGIICEGGQPFITIKYLLKEAQKTQNPDLYVIDLYMLDNDLSNINIGDTRRTIDSMNFNKNRLDATTEILKYSNIDKSEYINYYFSFLLYHNAWKNIDSSNFSINSSYRGFWFYDFDASEPQEEYKWLDDVIELSESNRQVLLDLIEYIKDNNLNVLFVVPKRGYWSPGQEKLNDAISIIQKNNLDIINFNKIDNLNINAETDFYDYGHLNLYGAIKYTLYFSKYLSSNYNLKKDKNDLEWQDEYDDFKLDFKKVTGSDLDEIIYYYKF